MTERPSIIIFWVIKKSKLIGKEKVLELSDDLKHLLI